jgi:hypothetical protein
MASHQQDVDGALNLIWQQWNGIKHVWESNEWPFVGYPQLNDRVALGSDRSVILMVRRNLLRRFVSNYLSRRTGYWIGTKTEFYRRLERVSFTGLDLPRIREQLKRDQSAISKRLALLSGCGIRFMTVQYENVFRDDSTQTQQYLKVSSILEFLHYEQIPFETFAAVWQKYFDSSSNQWSSPEVYRRIPGIDRVEEEIGCDETGWLFK